MSHFSSLLWYGMPGCVGLGPHEVTTEAILSPQLDILLPSVPLKPVDNRPRWRRHWFGGGSVGVGVKQPYRRLGELFLLLKHKFGG